MYFSYKNYARFGSLSAIGPYLQILATPLRLGEHWRQPANTTDRSVRQRQRCGLMHFVTEHTGAQNTERRDTHRNRPHLCYACDAA